MPGINTIFEPVETQDEYLFEDQFTGSDWKESIKESRIDSISRDRSRSTIKIICDFDKYKSAVRYILGYSYVDGSQLIRVTPVFHPQWSWLYAKAVLGVRFHKPISKAVENWDGSLYYATYLYAEIEVEFCEVRYSIWEDWEIDYEYERYTEEIPQPCAELVQIDGGQLIAHAPSVASVNAKPYISAPHVIARQEKNAFDLIWREVPKEFIFSASSTSPTGFGIATNLMAIQKRVNSVEFMGRRAGTLLCEEAICTVSPSPVATDLENGLKFTYDVTFKMKEFNPERGDTSVDKYGWNLLPGPRDVTGAGGERLFAYYYYTSTGTLLGKPLFESYDFAAAFRKVGT